MAKNDAERFPIGRTALGGAASGFTYDGALQDAVAREDRLRRRLHMTQWQGAARRESHTDADRERLEPAMPDLSV